MEAHPYLFYGGRCEEALRFYERALGARIDTLMCYRESPEPPSAEHPIPPGWEDKVMHASFHVGDSLIMASDGCGKDMPFQGFALSITVQGGAEAERLCHALADGGTVQMPLARTFWSPRFGAVADRYGISWMINTLY